MHTATLYQLSCSWTPDDIYIPQLYINFPADDDLVIYTYRNFISTFLQINTWWYIHTATLYQLSSRWSADDIYIPQLCINFAADEHLMIFTYRNFISIFLQLYTWWYIHTATLFFQQINTWWYIHTTTLYQLSCSWTPDDIYIPQL